MQSWAGRRLVIVAAVAVLASCAHRDGLRGWDPVAAARDSHALVIVGTFSSLRVTADGVFGAEVRIAVTNEPHYQAVVQFGAGQVCDPTEHRKQACFGLSNLHVVEARFDWDRPATGRMAFVSFHIPDPGPYSGRFEGMITDEALTGTFTPTNGKPWPLVMRRGLPFHERQAKPPDTRMRHPWGADAVHLWTAAAGCVRFNSSTVVGSGYSP